MLADDIIWKVIHRLKSLNVFCYLAYSALSIAVSTTVQAVARLKFTNSGMGLTVKPKIFVYPLFREFRKLCKFAKIMGCEYSNVNHLLSTSLIEPNTKLTGNSY